ncbi:hypothetical protein L2719_07245 [Shewanella schlegeliana]|uniref:Uncharacterized protein n=1 Tax=Shewanella schlegeliana TaxID=190308 RepID=A0ABS1SZQ6_9GAMM|nr:hypothetical protein [Shewanella schlegeliana]MBL4913384.1 hypothetical protein [Shewanella schlegeliana]MCL1109339.1 hypothetical protein [Shewanella schlegeliana]GIU38128.1 hypothetical protein TUM4433_39370 [Shewanella schlegeliana]
MRWPQAIGTTFADCYSQLKNDIEFCGGGFTASAYKYQATLNKGVSWKFTTFIKRSVIALA